MTKVKKATAKVAQVEKKVSGYSVNVLKVNQELKKVNKSLGGCRSALLNNANEIKLNPLFVKLLTQSKTGANYKLFAEKVRTSKNGNYSPFYILQTMNKHSKFFQENFK